MRPLYREGEVIARCHKASGDGYELVYLNGEIVKRPQKQQTTEDEGGDEDFD